jgi:two-component system, sensor histidine kinase and response regulator
MVSDPQKRIVSVNPAFQRVTGFSAEEAIGQTAHMIFPDRDIAPIYARVVDELDQKGSWQGEVITRHKDGHPIYAWLTVSSVRDAHGQIIHYVGFLKDLTKLKSVEEQVRKLSLAVEQSPSSIIITDLDGGIEYANPCFTQVTGFSAEEVIGKNPRLLKSGLTPAETYVALWAALTAGRSWQGEFINRHKDGHQIIEYATVSPVRQPDGQITHYLAVKHDITESKRMEQALRDNESRLRLALEGLGDGVWDWNVRSGHVYFSRQWLEMLGYREEDLTQNVKIWGRLIHPDDRATNRALLEAHLKNETPAYSHEYRLRTKVGNWKWILVRGAVIARASDGSATRMLGTHVDISQRKVLEESLIAATHAAQAANLAKSEFLANMSHEIRTPMNAILGLTDLAMESALDPEQQHYLELAHRSAEDLLRIINEILDFSKIEAGMLNLEEADFDLRQCIEAAVAPLAKRAHEKGLHLTLEVVPEAPDTVHGDPLRLRQVLINLISNAIKFTDRGDVTVRVAPLPDAGEPRQLLFTVADTGIGIPSDKLGMIFEPFCQADTSTTRRFGGTGLGLPISQRIVERMEGRLWVESRVAEGSAFFFSVTLPAVAASTGGKPRSVPAEAPVVEPRGPLTILLAEDNVVNQKLAVAMLERLGHSVEVAGDGAAAVAFAQHRRFDAILMDMQMPKMNGIEATRAIRAHESLQGSRTPIIALTANAFAEDRQRCIDAGMDDYLPKPVNRETLVNALAGVSPHEPAAVRPTSGRRA